MFGDNYVDGKESILITSKEVNWARKSSKKIKASSEALTEGRKGRRGEKGEDGEGSIELLPPMVTTKKICI